MPGIWMVFPPAKNPEMWTQALFDGLARLAHPAATIATFTCAGFVRRGLIAAGFAMKKVKGHGSKREMLAGERTDKQPQQTIAPLVCTPGRQRWRGADHRRRHRLGHDGALSGRAWPQGDSAL